MKIAPSVLTADFTNLKEEIESIQSADLIHIDIMDGNFVPNISFGPAITKQISKLSNINLDVHLMVSNPLDWIEEFNLHNVEYITVHVESNDYEQAIEKIKSIGKKVGITLKPKTKLDKIAKYLPLVDLVLVMSVEPGFGGQKLIPEMLDRVKELKNLKKEQNFNYIIEIDGGVNVDTYKDVCMAGVDLAVVGSYLFNQQDRKKTIEKLRCE